MSSRNLDAQTPATPPVASPRLGDVVNPTLRRAMLAAAAVGLAGGLVCALLASRDGWGELWTDFVLFVAALGGGLYAVFAVVGLVANWFSARRYGRERKLASTDVMMVIPGTAAATFAVVFVLAAVLRPGS
jgi:MFS family permease